MTQIYRRPNLAGEITKEDVKEKPTGFRAKYMAWAKVSQIMNDKASGWDFHLRPTFEGKHVWEAPNGTGYLTCYFTGPEEDQTSDVLFAIMDTRKNPIKTEQITARNLTDNTRRAYCLACAFFFSLAYELWADEEIEEIDLEEKIEPQPECQLKNTKEEVTPVVTKKETSKQELINEVVGFIQTKFDKQEEQVNWVAEKATEFNLKGDGSKLAQMTIPQLKACIQELKGA